MGMVEMRIDGHCVSLGYGLAQRYWGRSYMAEAVAAIIDWALRQDGVYRVWAVCDVENRASARVLEKVGMRREGRLRENFRTSEGWADSCLYAILDHEWEARG